MIINKPSSIDEKQAYLKEFLIANTTVEHLFHKYLLIRVFTLYKLISTYVLGFIGNI